MQRYSLDTLAQVGKFGISTTPNNLKDSYKKRAKAKAISDEMAYKLIRLKSPLEKAYRNTLYCSSVILQDGNKVTSRYCKNRSCLVCNRIRSANLIRGYYSTVSDLPNLTFLTLTVPAVKYDEITSTEDRMRYCFNQIVDILRKTHKIKLKAIRKTECNYNPDKDTYNPHYHIVCSLTGCEAILIINEWIKRFDTADHKAQDVRKAHKNTLPELFKYFTKMLTKGKFEAQAQDHIFNAFKGKRLVASYGIKKQVSEDIDNLIAQEIDFKDSQNEIWVWQRDVFDWVNSQGETFADYTPNIRTYELIENIRKERKPIKNNVSTTKVIKPEWIKH